jgi:tetratricopeptide (TPR) repeat protein
MPTLDEEVRSCNQQGMALAQQGRLDESAACFRRARQLQPKAPAAHNNLGNILFFQGQLDEAVACYRTALSLVPNDPPTLNNLGNALRKLGEMDEAVRLIRRAVELRPEYAEAHSNLALALEATDQLDEALFHCQTALRLRPDFADAYNNLSVVLRGLGRFEEAIAACHEALRRQPDSAEAHSNLGSALVRLERWEEAETNFRRALLLRPNMAETRVSLASCCWRQDRFDEAIQLCEEALRQKPKLAAAYNALGVILYKQNRFDEAMPHLDQALRLEPNHAEAHFNRAMVLLHMGDFTEGWREYEWRWKCKTFVVSASQRTPWDGSPLAGRTILLCVEQGLGDTLQFIRYAPQVKQQGATVLLLCSGKMIPLLSRCAGIDQFVAQDAAIPSCDTHIPLLSLPSRLGTTLATIPKPIPYLFADERLVEHWRRELTAYAGFKVGIAWQGNKDHPLDRHRSMSLSHFEPVALPGVQLLSLQKGPGSEQLATVAGRFAVTDLGRRLDETCGAFMDTAAVMQSLDLVITSDTAIAHLAGGLGVPVWVALPFVADWRWLRDRPDSPWYPTMRLFRQTTAGDWDGVFTAMAAELARRLHQRSGTVSIPIAIGPGELLDKIANLEVQRERLTDPARLTSATAELQRLVAARHTALQPLLRLAELAGQLKQTHLALAEAEDALRACERADDFGPRFVELARSLYRQRDRRDDLKREIDELLG